jgi:MFS-type transporter involved in bile tolerance (Atg22 family)
MGISGYLTRSPRAGIATLSVFFMIGGILLFLVDEKNSG